VIEGREKLPITVLIQTKNEEAGIRACVLGLGDFGEVIVVDSDSTDRTKEIARELGANVVNFSWNGAYPKKKQWQLDNVNTAHEWVLFMDADETPTPELVEELRAKLHALSSSTVAAVDIPLSYVFAGRTLRHGHRVVKRALVRRGRVRFPVVDDLGAPGMGELEGHYQPEADGGITATEFRILHHDVDPVRTWFDRHNKYSDWEAYLRTSPNAKGAVGLLRSRQGQLFDHLPGKPLIFFLYSYVLRCGFLDGRAGLDYALALSGYYWQIGLKTRERHRDGLVDSR
jgi:glycosyltransferase involved in cell wall biosynthesis